MSKLSLHISDWLNPEVTYDFIESTKPPIIKVFGDAGLDDVKIRQALQFSPASVVVGRMYFPEQGIERDETAPVDTVMTYNALDDAHHAFDQMRPIIEKLRGLVTVWEGYNEIPIDTSAPLTERDRQKARNLNDFTVEMARQMHDAGMKYAGYSFSTGNPVHLELWDLLLDGLAASDYLALHEYIAPNEEWTEFNWSMCNRYREIYARVPIEKRKPVLITECGADYLGQQGFRGKISAPQYMEMMARYDAELMQDPVAIGATIYCYGINAPQWKTYNIDGEFTQRLREYIQSTPTPPIELPPVTVPVPEPTAPPAQPGLMRLAEALALTRQAREMLKTGDGDGAHAILQNQIVPWFYATAPEHSTDLANAQAHTTARWYCEEALRRIEAGDNASAGQLLDANVAPWLESPGPGSLGILSVKSARKKRTPARKTRARAKKPTPLLLSPTAAPKPKSASAKKKSRNRRT